MTSAAKKAGSMLHQLDQSRRESMSRVACTVSGCRSELLCRTEHVDNLKTTWRCLEHRDVPITPKGTNP